MSDPTRYFDEDEAAKRLNLSARTMQRMRQEGWGPEYARLGLRRIAYSEAALDAYAASRTFRHRADELSRAAQPKLLIPAGTSNASGSVVGFLTARREALKYRMAAVQSSAG